MDISKWLGIYCVSLSFVLLVSELPNFERIALMMFLVLSKIICKLWGLITLDIEIVSNGGMDDLMFW